MTSADSLEIKANAPARTHAAARLWQLDVLRAVAVLLVLARHIPTALRPGASGWSSGEGWPAPVSWFIRGGWVGVDLFFVLSGYLIGGLLLGEAARTGTVNIRRFLVRRAWRLYPPFYAFLAVALAVHWIHEGAPSLRQVAVTGLFLQTYVSMEPLVGEIHAHAWSLCVEEHFYLLLPLLIGAMLWFGRRNGRAGGLDLLPGIALLVAIAALVLRIGAAREGNVWTAMLPTHLRIDSLMMGVVLAWARRCDVDRFEAFCRRRRWTLLGLGALGLAPAFMWDLVTTPFIYTFGLTLFAMASCCLVAGALGLHLPGEAGCQQAPPRRLRTKHKVADSGLRGLALGFAGLGRVSYSTYLWHWPIALAMGAHLSRAIPGPVRGLLFLLLSALAGAVAARLIEAPTLRLRDRLTPPAPTDPATSAT